MMALTAALVVCVIRFVNLAPSVDQNFFFAAEDPQLKSSLEIDRRYAADSQLYIVMESPDIASDSYLQRVGALTEKARNIKGVANVRSVTAGPKDFRDASQSPLWRRLLIAADKSATNLILGIRDADMPTLVSAVQALREEFQAPDFQIHLSGEPFVVEMIRRSLVHDLIYFTTATLVIFGILVSALFRSAKVLLGVLTACVGAMAATLLAQHFLGIQMGILTTNLSTMVFVLTLSHIIFMTANWQTLSQDAQLAKHGLSRAAVLRTLPPSFWCMVTTVLGFGSLLMVPARPLRDLGYGGCLGTLAALVCAYGMYPPFLRWAKPRLLAKRAAPRDLTFWSRPFVIPVVAIAFVCGALMMGLPRLNTDPSLQDYFARKSEARRGLDFVDRTGGSNLLKMVVRSKDGKKLNTRAAYEQMWMLQNALEQQPEVGSVISLPVLMAEANRPLMARPLPWELLIGQMETDKFERIAENFVNKDRTETMFFMRMVESERHGRHHLEVVAKLESIARRLGFEPVLTGSVYALHGELSSQVHRSLTKGLGWLVAIFAVIAFIVARAWRMGIAMIAGIAVLPLAILGAIGLLGVPLDIISAPAANVCIGMGVDAMIHLVTAVRRNRTGAPTQWAAWTRALQEQWRAVVGSAIIVATGFAIFVLSDFPPTQRFGLAVVFGTMLAAVLTLCVAPLLGGWQRESKS